MTNPSSPIIDFYPSGNQSIQICLVFCFPFCWLFLGANFSPNFLVDFELDMNGKRFAWQVLFGIPGLGYFHCLMGFGIQ